MRELHAADRGLLFAFERRVTVAIAEAFDLAAKPDSAVAYYEKYLAAPDPFVDVDALFRAGTHKRLGELYEARGDTPKAESHYAKFLELWKDADPELQPKVREVRERLARLRRRQG